MVSPLWIQYQLDTCATLQHVIANDSRVRIGDTTDHFLVCDRTDNNPQIRAVDLTRLDFACGTPVQMLDVYAPSAVTSPPCWSPSPSTPPSSTP